MPKAEVSHASTSAFFVGKGRPLGRCLVGRGTPIAYPDLDGRFKLCDKADVSGSVSSMHRRSLAGLGMAFCFACACRDPPSLSASQLSNEQPVQGARCFDVVVRDNSLSTRNVLSAKRCQGGGVTWAAILGVLMQKRGPSKAIEAATPGWTGDVRALSWNGKTVRVAIDVEGDSARFCTDSGQILADVRNDVARLNANPAELERAMREADPLALECSLDGASVSTLLSGMAPPPPPSPAEARARETSLARLRSTLAKERTWCWRKSGMAFGGKGGFTLHPDGRVTGFGGADVSGTGRWTFQEDRRIEIVGPGLHHFDVGDTGHLGFNHSQGREELDPCPAPGSSK